MRQFFKVCLWTQVFAFLFATLLFSGLEDPRLAGSLTGPVFLLTGALPFLGIFVRRTNWKQSSFWCSMAFTGIFSGPMLGKRLLLYGQNFSEMTFYGIPSADFHRLSGVAFLILSASLIYDIYSLRKK